MQTPFTVIDDEYTPAVYVSSGDTVVLLYLNILTHYKKYDKILEIQIFVRSENKYPFVAEEKSLRNGEQYEFIYFDWKFGFGKNGIFI